MRKNYIPPAIGIDELGMTPVLQMTMTKVVTKGVEQGDELIYAGGGDGSEQNGGAPRGNGSSLWDSE